MKFKAKMVTPVDIFRRKKIDARPMSTRERAMLPAAERVNSIFTANVEKAQFLQRLADMFDNFLSGKKQEIILPDGTSTTVGVMQGKADFIAKARAFMAAEGMTADARDNRITNIGARSRLSLIFDTMTRCCYGQARWESGMTPEMLYSYPAWRFVRHPGARMPRPLHVLNEGAVRLKTDFQFWAVEMNSPAIGGFLLPWPLYGFNSWMDIESVSRAECIQDGLISPNWTPGPVDMSRFGATMPERLMNRSASVQKVKDPDLAARLRESLKKRLGVDALDKDGRLAIPARELAQRMQRQAEQENPGEISPLQMTLDLFEPERKDSAMAGLMKKAGLRPRGEATLEQVEAFLNALKTRHPERDWVKEKVENGISGEFRPMAKETIRKNMNEFMRMVDPEILETLPPMRSVDKDTNFGNRGSFNPITRTIFYSSGEEFDKDNHFHELVHWLHFNGENAKNKKIGNYFQKRIKGEKRGRLSCGSEGYSDHFAPSFEQRDDYAGKIYGREPLDGMPYGVEMPTRHLQKLALSPNEFLRYWNDTRDGKHYWRMAFLRSLTLLFK